MGTGDVVVTVRSEPDHHQDVAAAAAPSLISKETSFLKRRDRYLLLLIRSMFICFFVIGEIIYINGSVFDEETNHKSMLTTLSLVTSILLLVITLLIGSADADEDADFIYLMKFVGSFFAFLAPFSLLMLLVLPPGLNWIAYLVICVMFCLLVTCFGVDNQQVENSTEPPTRNKFLLYGIPFITMATLWLLQQITSVNGFVYMAIKVGLWVECTYHFIAYLMFIHEQTAGKPKENQQADEKNSNDPIPPPPASSLSQLSYLMPLENSPS